MRQKYYKQKWRADLDSKQFDGTVEHVISAWPVLGREQYIQRHDTVCAELHCNMCKEMGGKLGNKQLGGHVLKLVMQGYHIMERTVQTDGSIFTTDRTAECVVINKERHFDGCCNSCTQKCDEKSSSEGCNI